MLTTAQYNYLKTNLLLQGVWDTIVKESPLTQRLPHKPVNNDIIKYDIELTMPTVSWLTVGDTITENTGTVEERTTNVYTLIGDADTDKSKKRFNPTQDPEALDISAKAKAMAHAFELALIMGQTTTDTSSKEFKGLLRILAEMESSTTTDLDAVNNDQVIAVHATSGAVTMPYMDELVDQIKPGKPDLFICSRRARRKLNALARASGTSGLSPIHLEEFGLFVPSYDAIPVFVNDWLPDNLPNNSSSVLSIAAYDQSVTRTTDYDNTVIFAMKVSEEDVTALMAGEMEHERETFVEGKNVIRNRFTWYNSLMCKKKFSLAALIGINPDS